MPVFPDHHRRDSLRALNVRNVEALDALGKFGQAERVLQFFLNGFRVGLEHAEALIVRLLGVIAGEVDERAFVATQWNDDVDSCRADTLVRHLLGEQVFESFTVLKIDRDVDIAGHVGLADVELLEQSGEKFAGMELIFGAELIVWGRALLPVRAERSSAAYHRCCGAVGRRRAVLAWTGKSAPVPTQSVPTQSLPTSSLTVSASSVVNSGRSSQKNSRRSTILPARMWNRFTASIPFSEW